MAQSARFPLVRFQYIDASYSERQGSTQDEVHPQISEVAGFLIRETAQEIEVAREIFFEGNYAERRGLLTVPRCALRGKVRRVKGG